MSDIATKLTTIAENQQKVYDAGYAKGQAEGGDTDAAYQQGVADGKKAEYDRFWDVFQENGNRANYTAAFSGRGWTAETLNPKYDVVPVNATQIFARESFAGDVVAHFESIGKKLDFSKCTALVEMFYYTNITRVGVIDTRAAKSLASVFAYSLGNLETIDLLILKEDGSQSFNNNSFIQNTGLKNIKIQGVIGQSVDFQWSVLLSKESISSIVNALSITASGQTLTLSKVAVTNAFGSTTADEWTALIATKSNWTISLV